MQKKIGVFFTNRFCNTRTHVSCIVRRPYQCLDQYNAAILVIYFNDMYL